MKRTFLILSLVFLSFSYVVAQDSIESKIRSGFSKLQQGKYNEAIQDLTFVIENDTTVFGLKFAYINRGFAKNGLEKYSEAIEDFDKAIEIDPNDMASFIDRAKAKQKLNDIDGAIADYNHIISVENSGEQVEAAFYYLGLIAYYKQEYEKSVEYYSKLIELAPNDYEAFYIRGAAKGMLMDTKGAIADYDKAIKYNPNYMEAYANRGIAKINLLTGNGNINPSKSETKDACKDLQKAKKLGDTTVDDMIFLYCKGKGN